MLVNSQPKGFRKDSAMIVSGLFVSLFLVLIVKHTVHAATFSFSGTPSGGDCSLVGTWDPSTKTCTLATDLAGSLSIESPDLTLNGAGHTITGTTTAIMILNQSNITIQNLTIRSTTGGNNFSEYGIYLLNTASTTISQVTLIDKGLGVRAEASPRTHILDSLCEGTLACASLENGSDSSIIRGLTSRRSAARQPSVGIGLSTARFSILEDNVLSDSFAQGLSMNSSGGNLITHNTFINNNQNFSYSSNSFFPNQTYQNNFHTELTQSIYLQHPTGGRDAFFNSDPSVGGNWWEQFDEPSEGCTDNDSNSFCDSPRTFPFNAHDDLAWVRERGWEAPTRDPVIIIPGIAGSELFDGSNEIWIDTLQMALSIGDDFLDVLLTDAQGQSINQIGVGDIIRQKIGVIEIWVDMIDDLKSQGYVENQDLFVFPYDWRLDNRATAEQLHSKIQSVLSSTGASKVDLLAHSMGGLVVKQYVNNHGESVVDQIVFIGTPHYGAPKSLKTLMFGDTFGIPQILTPLKIRDLSLNMFSVYQLLPSLAYFTPYLTYFYDFADVDNNGVTGLLNFNQVHDLIGNLGLNTTLRDDGEAFHTNNLDNWQITPALQSRVHNIVGCARPTIGSIVSQQWVGGKIEYYIETIDGDSTVPRESALGVSSGRAYFIPQANHARLPDNLIARQLILDILDDNDPDLTGPNYTTIKDGVANCTFQGTLSSVHSPVDLHAYDSLGNHTGPNAQGGIDEDIPGSSYERLGEDNFIFIPSGIHATLQLQGTATGTFNTTISDITELGEQGAAKFYDVPVTSQLKGNISLILGLPLDQLTLDLDTDGNGTTDQTIVPSAILDDTDVADRIAPTTTLNLSGQQGNNGWFISPVEVTLTPTDNQGGSGIFETRYSLDNGITWLVYASPFIISQEGTHTLRFFSIDQAGNVEQDQSSTILIDLTPPEFDVAYDISTRHVVFTSPDATVACAPEQCSAEDAAGHTTALTFRTEQVDKHEVVTLRSIAYDGGTPQFFGTNILHVRALFDHTNFSMLKQEFVTAREGLRLEYIPQENITRVTHLIREEIIERSVVPGVKVLHVMTNQGNIFWNY